MWTAATATAFALDASKKYLDRLLDDLSASDWLCRPTAKANCAAWIVGHLIISDRSALKRAGATDLPALPEGFEQRFGRGEEAPAAADFGDTSILRPLYDKTRRQLVDFARGLSDEQLEKSLSAPHPLFGTVGELLAFVSIHTGLHAGHISTIRRVIGRPPII